MKNSTAQAPEPVSAFDPTGAVPGQDYSGREGAERLKAIIEAYWRARGADVMVALENAGFHAAIRAARYELRSDMVNGWPRRAANADKKEE